MLSDRPVHGPIAVLTGLRALVDGLRRLARSPRLRLPVALLAGLHLVALTTAVVAGWSLGESLIAGRLSGLPDTAVGDVVRFFATTLVRVALIAVSWVAASWLAGVLGGPIYERLSAAVEVEDGTLPDDDATLAMIAGDVAQGIRHSLLAAVLYGLGHVVLLPVLLVPVLGSLAWPLLTGAWSAFFLAREVLDHPTSRRRWRFRRKLSLIARFPWLFGGLGLGLWLGVLVPVVNLITLAAGVVAATALFGALERAGLTPPDRTTPPPPATTAGPPAPT